MLALSISIQKEDFNLGDEVDALQLDNAQDGAVVTFSGRVRDNNLNKHVVGLSLEHYPGMTEKQLEKIVNDAQKRWNIGRVRIIHRIGDLLVGDQIVFVGVTSKHRQDAFAACEFIMDFLKIKATFWKKELTDDGQSTWLDAKVSDQDKAGSW